MGLWPVLSSSSAGRPGYPIRAVVLPVQTLGPAPGGPVECHLDSQEPRPTAITRRSAPRNRDDCNLEDAMNDGVGRDLRGGVRMKRQSRYPQRDRGGGLVVSASRPRIRPNSYRRGASSAPTDFRYPTSIRSSSSAFPARFSLRSCFSYGSAARSKSIRVRERAAVEYRRNSL